MHIQLDPVGGVAGDMFAAAVLDAWPELESPLVAALQRAGLDAIATVERVDHADHALTGSRFAVYEAGRRDRAPGAHDRDAHDHGRAPDPRRGHDDAATLQRGSGGGQARPHGRDGNHEPGADGAGDSSRDRDHDARRPGPGDGRERRATGGRVSSRHADAHPHDHGDGDAPIREHHLYRDIRALLEGSDLDPGVRVRALDVFARLARAESAVHGVPVDEVSFHEVGAYDSIADIVCAAWLIQRLDATWWCGPLPIGRGRVETSHGRLPVPAPATVELLRGMVVDQDTHHGERITPTGAAIVAHLAPSFEPLPGPVRLHRCGTGFGTSLLPGTSNVLRLLAFEPVRGLDAAAHRERIAVCEFEIDDQTGEDLALALDRLRDRDGVLDVCSHAMHGKKGRLAVHVRLLARLAAVESAIEACLCETTTLGVRWHEVSRVALARESMTVTVDGRPVRVKSAHRPGETRTSKAEIDDLATVAGGHADRERVRVLAERAGGGGDV